MRVAILMPTHSEGTRLTRTLSSLCERAAELGTVGVFLVDDGSEPAVLLSELPGPTPHFQITLVRHVANLGQGAALQTARQLGLREPPFDAYVTMDADGQHGVD